MGSPTEPMAPAVLRRLMGDRSDRAAQEQDRNESKVDPFSLAIASVVARRRGSDWRWLDQDRSTHPR